MEEVQGQSVGKVGESWQGWDSAPKAGAHHDGWGRVSEGTVGMEAKEGKGMAFQRMLIMPFYSVFFML